MKIIISKILNKTDLAESGAHGGLVVTKNIQHALLDFFENVGEEKDFQDVHDEEVFPIHYIDYTSNGTTPNDRITPIGKYASKYNLKPGDNLLLQKIDVDGRKKYYIEYMKKLKSTYFVGRSKEIVQALDYNQFTDIIYKNVSENKIKVISKTACKMKARYEGVIGVLEIHQDSENFELLFDGEKVGENNKYFELDTTVYPFELNKKDTWGIEIHMDEDESSINDQEDNELISDIASVKINVKDEEYIAQPEEKKPAKKVGDKIIPNRNRETAKKALCRAEFLCEFDTTHKLFKKKTDGLNYTEPHHLIPLKYDELFEKSLDVQANIVSLCSHCHNLVHYGMDAEIIVRKLWDLRKEELDNAGLGVMKDGTKMSIDILLGFYGINR